MSEFKLSDNFIEKYAGKQPEWGPLGYITYKRTYARPILEENRTEEWWETCRRVVEGTYQIQKDYIESIRVPWIPQKAQVSAQTMFDLMWNFKFLPPGRGLWMMGTEYVRKRGGAALNNCGFVSTKDIAQDFAEPFLFLMDMSMLGVGVGGDTKGAGSLKLKVPKQGNYTFTVEDSREGWVELVRTFLNAYVGKSSLPNSVDYSKVRVYGEPIKGFGGTASGPAPLKQLVEQDIPKILGPLAEADQPITSTAIVDLFNVIGRCVVSGNVRRSAEIMFGDPLDEDFLSLKLDKKLLKEYRWASNNSILASVGMDYAGAATRTAVNGEPGYLWLDTARRYGRLADPANDSDRRAEGSNPCSEQTLESYELCCLVETFPARHGSFEEYRRTLKFAYLYAKTVTLLPTHNPRTNAVLLRNRRIGTSQSGIAQSIERHGIREHFRWCDQGYKYLRDLDRIYSDWFCVPRSIKITSVKPSGTVSLLCGATPGVHYSIGGEYSYRTMRFDSGSELLGALRKAGYRIEEGEGHTTSVVYFPVKEENCKKSIKDASIWEQLEIAAQMQFYWADNQVSVTIQFQPHEAEQIPLALQLYETRLKSVSFLPYELGVNEDGSKKYEHPPIQPITQEEYEKAIKKIKPLKIGKTTETQGFDNKYCDADVCVIS